jgi:hypothetical protein
MVLGAQLMTKTTNKSRSYFQRVTVLLIKKNYPSTSCKIVFNQKDSVKICSPCFKMTHFVCNGLTTKSSKKWTCAECFEYFFN